jgi:hypothetical protein
LEIDSEVERGTVRPVEAVTLLLDIVSLNVFVFALLPIIRPIFLDYYKDEKEFLEARKKENIETVMRRLVRNETGN